jgi:UDP-galactopyranose mutase
MKHKNSFEAVILGAGLAGLSAAYHLNEMGCRGWVILERSDRVGGLCKSLKYDGGFTFDQSIHILYSSDPYASELIKKLLDGNLNVHKRESWVYSRGVFTPYPWQANTHGLPVEIVKECLMGVIKATYEKNGKQPSVNFEEWCFATFGDGLAKHFMIPYNTKLWAIDLKGMTDAWIKDRVMTPLLDEVVEGALHRPKRDYGPNSVFWYPEKGGIEALPRGFLPYLDKKKIFLNTGVEKIFWEEKCVLTADGGKMHYKKLISSLPLPVIMKQLEPVVSPDLRDAAGSLEHNKVYAVNIAVKREKLSPYHWVYYPEEKYLLHRISFPGNFSAYMTPGGWSSITVEISASKYRQIPAGAKLIERVIADLRESKMVMDDDIVEVKSVLVLNPAYVVYNHNHRGSVDKLHQFLRENEIFPCGRFGEWEYLNMDHSILSGKIAVESIVKTT